jgi:hypothetical protein
MAKTQLSPAALPGRTYSFTGKTPFAWVPPNIIDVIFASSRVKEVSISDRVKEVSISDRVKEVSISIRDTDVYR